MSMKIERSSVDQVKKRIDLNKKKLEEKKKEYYFEERMKELKEEEEKAKAYRKEKKKKKKMGDEAGGLGEGEEEKKCWSRRYQSRKFGLRSKSTCCTTDKNYKQFNCKW